MINSNPKFFGIFVSVLFFLLPLHLFAQWQIDSLGIGARGSVATGSDGAIHLCYLSEPYSGDLIYAVHNGDQWVVDTLIKGGLVNQCVICVDPLNDLHIAFVEEDWDSGVMALQYMLNQGSGWSEPDTVTTEDFGMWALSMDTDPEGYVHLGYMQAYGGASNGPPAYLNNREGPWEKNYISAVYDDYAYAFATRATRSIFIMPPTN